MNFISHCLYVIQGCTMEDLSDEIILRIFRLLNARDLCRSSQVCTSWCRLANDFHLWRNLFIKKFDRFVTDPLYYHSIEPTQWKEYYILKANWFSGHCHVQSLHKKVVANSLLTSVKCLKISGCGRNLLASVNDGTYNVHVWSLPCKRNLHVVKCEGVVQCVDFGSECSRNILAAGLDCNKFCLWDVQRERFVLRQVNLESNFVARNVFRGLDSNESIPRTAVCCVNLHGNKLASVTKDCVVRVWQLEFDCHGNVSCHCLHTLTTFKARCSVLDIQLKREFTDDVWSVAISHAAEVLDDWNLIGFQSVQFQGQTLLSFGQGAQVADSEDDTIIRQEKYSLRPATQEQMASRTMVSCLSISPCANLVTSGQEDNTILLWDTLSQSHKHTLFGHTGSVTCTDVDMHKVVSGSNDRTVKVWSLESGNCQLTLPEGHSTGVSCVTFNDQWVVSGDNSGEIKVWDFAVNSLSILQGQDQTVGD